MDHYAACAAAYARLTWNQRSAGVSASHSPGQRTVASGLTTRLPQPLLCRMSSMCSSVRSASLPNASTAAGEGGQAEGGQADEGQAEGEQADEGQAEGEQAGQSARGGKAGGTAVDCRA
jgi:hypothetical protein